MRQLLLLLRLIRPEKPAPSYKLWVTNTPKFIVTNTGKFIVFKVS